MTRYAASANPDRGLLRALGRWDLLALVIKYPQAVHEEIPLLDVLRPIDWDRI